MADVYIIGATGYTGGELLRILSNHPEIDKITATSRTAAGEKIKEHHKNIRTDVSFEKLDIDKANSSDFVFCCVPHKTAMDIVPELTTKVVDLSADFRLSQKDYEQAYGVRHKCPELLKDAVYGLPELHRTEIKKARIVANPGCFSTGAILACYPLVKEFKPKLVIDSKTGVSGAGNNPTKTTHFCTADEDILPYKVTEHRHIPEMEQELKTSVMFTPHMVPLNRGILTTVHAFTDAQEVGKLYCKYYQDEPFVDVVDMPSLAAVRGSNICQIGGFEAKDGRLVLFSTIDNLTKGASGQAVQNMNLMAGYDETAGLEGLGLNP